MFAPPSKSCRFSHPPSPCAKSMAQGISLSADSDLEGTCPLRTPRQLRSAGAAFSGTVFQNLFVSAQYFLMFAFLDFAVRFVGTRRAVSAGFSKGKSVENVPPSKSCFPILFQANESDTARRVPTSLLLASCAQLEQPFRGQFFRIFLFLHDTLCTRPKPQFSRTLSHSPDFLDTSPQIRYNRGNATAYPAVNQKWERDVAR